MSYQIMTKQRSRWRICAIRTIIAILEKNGKEGATILRDILEATHEEKNFSLKPATFSTVNEYEDRNYRRIPELPLPTAISWSDSKHQHHPEQRVFRGKNVTVIFEGQIYSPSQIMTEQEILKSLPEKTHSRLGERILRDAEGDFIFLILEKERIVAGRDSLGIRPLYYGENDTFTALASRRKDLWKAGIEHPHSFPPGNLAVITKKGFRFKPIKTLSYSEPEPMTMNVAAERLQNLLEKAVYERVVGTTEIAVAFSGGLDSSIIAVLAKKYSANVHLFHVSLKNQQETIDAEKAAGELNLPIKTYLYTQRDVENSLPKVVGIIEEDDPVNASIGVPLYWTARRVAEEGFHMLLTGQGADELFGGYQRYIDQYILRGEREVTRSIFNDIRRLHEKNIERDVKICSFHNIELRSPFTAYQVADLAVRMPLQHKIEKIQWSQRKLVLRKVAKNLKIPGSIADKPKKAVQYATGVNEAIREIAKKRKATVREYINNLFIMERNSN